MRRYDAKKINSIVLSFAKLLLTATSTRVYHLGGLPSSHPPPISGNGTANLTECIVRSLEETPSGALFAIGTPRNCSSRGPKKYLQLWILI
jgi:hypothetical protein